MFNTVRVFAAALVVASAAGRPPSAQPPTVPPPSRTSAAAAADPPPSVEELLTAIAARLTAIETRLDTLAPAARTSPPSSSTTTTAAARTGYPTRPASTWWSGCNGWAHLDTGEHRGQFSRAWLATLTAAEVQSLHSDAHEGRVNWSYAVRPAAAAEVPAVTYPPGLVATAAASTCPVGGCPATTATGRRFFFRR